MGIFLGSQELSLSSNLAPFASRFTPASCRTGSKQVAFGTSLANTTGTAVNFGRANTSELRKGTNIRRKNNLKNNPLKCVSVQFSSVQWLSPV